MLLMWRLSINSFSTSTFFSLSLYQASQFVKQSACLHHARLLSFAIDEFHQCMKLLGKEFIQFFFLGHATT